MTGSRRPPLALVFAVTLTGIMSNTLLSPLVPDILDDLGQPDDRAGVLIAAGSLPGILVAPMIGVLADRLGRRAVLVPCLAVFGLAGLAVAAAPTFAVLVAARLVMGVGSAGLINLAVVVIGDHWEGDERTHLIGRNAAVLTIGLAAMPLLSGSLSELAGWRVSLLPYSMALVTAAAAWRILDRSRPEQSQDLGAQLREAAGILRQPVVLALLASGFLAFVLIFGMYLTALPVHLEEEFGLGAGARGVVLAIPAVTSTVVAFNLARIRRRIGLRRVLVSGSLVFVVSLTTLGLAPTMVLVVVGAAVYGLAEGAFIPTLQDVAASAAPQRHRGAVLAVWVGAARTGQTTGPLASAAVFGAVGTGTTLVLGGVMALSIVAIQVVGPLGSPDRRTPVAPAHG